MGRTKNTFTSVADASRYVSAKCGKDCFSHALAVVELTRRRLEGPEIKIVREFRDAANGCGAIQELLHPLKAHIRKVRTTAQGIETFGLAPELADHLRSFLSAYDALVPVAGKYAGTRCIAVDATGEHVAEGALPNFGVHENTPPSSDDGFRRVLLRLMRRFNPSFPTDSAAILGHLEIATGLQAPVTSGVVGDEMRTASWIFWNVTVKPWKRLLREGDPHREAADAYNAQYHEWMAEAHESRAALARAEGRDLIPVGPDDLLDQPSGQTPLRRAG